MANITFKSIIAQAIADFNSIQNAIARKDSTLATTADSAEGSSLLATTAMPGKIKEYLVFPKENLAITDQNIGADASGIYTVRVADVAEASKERTGYETITIPKAVFGVEGSQVKVTTAGYIKSGLTIGTVEAASGYTLTGKDDESSLLRASQTTVKITGSDRDYYVFSGSLTATLAASKAGYFTSSGEVTDNDVKFGIIEKATFTTSSADNNKITPTHYMTAKDVSSVESGVIGLADTAYGTGYKSIQVELSSSGSQNVSVTTSSGYVPASTTTSVTATVNDATKTSKFIGIRTATWNVTGVTLTPSALTVGNTASNSTYPVTANIAALIKPTAAGYVDTTDGTGSLSKTITVGSIAAGSVTSNVVNVITTMTPGNSISFINKPASGTEGVDYFKITATATADSVMNLTPGYIYTAGTASGVTNGGESISYIPAAKFKFVKDDSQTDADGHPLTFIQCSTAGYLTTGNLALVDDQGNALTSESALGSLLDAASVKATISTAEENIINSGAYPSSGGYGYYALDITKGSIDPGYFSGSLGTLGLTSTYYINKTVVTPSVTDLTASTTVDMTAVAKSNTATAYKIDLTANASAKATATVPSDGYVKTTNTNTTATATSTSAATESIYIAAATFESTGTGTAITSKTVSPTASGGDAKVYSNDQSPTNYVVVNATGYNQMKVGTAGHTAAANTVVSTTSEATARIAATIGSDARSLSKDGATAGFTTTSVATTYTVSETDISKSAPAYAITATAAGVTDAAAKDTYIIGNYTASVTLNGGIELPQDATGSSVDDYVLSLYRRMSGLSYAAVTDDAGQNLG